MADAESVRERGHHRDREHPGGPDPRGQRQGGQSDQDPQLEEIVAFARNSPRDMSPVIRQEMTVTTVISITKRSDHQIAAPMSPKARINSTATTK